MASPMPQGISRQERAAPVAGAGRDRELYWRWQDSDCATNEPYRGGGAEAWPENSAPDGFMGPKVTAATVFAAGGVMCQTAKILAGHAGTRIAPER